MKSLLKPYTNIKELVDAVEELFNAKVVDGYQRGSKYYCQLDGEGLKIQVMMPQ